MADNRQPYRGSASMVLLNYLHAVPFLSSSSKPSSESFRTNKSSTGISKIHARITALSMDGRLSPPFPFINGLGRRQSDNSLDIGYLISILHTQPANSFPCFNPVNYLCFFHLQNPTRLSFFQNSRRHLAAKTLSCFYK